MSGGSRMRVGSGNRKKVTVNFKDREQNALIKYINDYGEEEYENLKNEWNKIGDGSLNGKTRDGMILTMLTQGHSSVTIRAVLGCGISRITKVRKKSENPEYNQQPYTEKLSLISTGKMEYKNFATKAIHAGWEKDEHGAVIHGISTATTFAQKNPGEPYGIHEYSRSSNPTRQAFEGALAAVEGGQYGLVFSSGLAATMTVTNLLSSGDHILCVQDVYGGTARYFKHIVEKFGIVVDYVDGADVTSFGANIKANTKLVWIESPTNPTLLLTDIKAVCSAAHKYKDCIVVVDNTFASAYFQSPLELGADIVMHSLSKYMNGHSDAIMGALILNDKIMRDKLAFNQNALGGVPSPFDCYLGHRGLKTLEVRMKKHEENAFAIANVLESSPYIEKVIYPGLKSHPQHELAKCQMKGFSGMISFYLKGDIETSKMFLKTLKIITLAESLGGIESLIELPSVMTHHSLTPEARAKVGISDTLIRLSVGIEGTEDLIEDLMQALNAAQK